MQTMKNSSRGLVRKLVPMACVMTSLLAGLGAQAATIVISSRDAAGVGFNDPTPVDPVGGNPGTTLGEQRMIVYRHVANLWEAALQSNVTIQVSAGWEALSCTATGAVLGSAGAWNIWYDVPGGIPGTWYPQALANKLAGFNLADGQADDGSGYGNVDIKTQFNINLGNAGCLTGSPFYLGLDNNAGAKVNFATVLLHELGHGLGFSVMTVSTSTGNRLMGIPSVWEQFMYDNTAGKSWLNMTALERKASAINPLNVAWTGANAVGGVPSTLLPTPTVKVTTPVPGVTGFYDYGTASFGPPITTPSALGKLAVLSDAANLLACNPLNAADAKAVAGKVAIIDRGICGFTVKVKNAQVAGAVAVLIADNVVASLSGLGGADPTITIPSARITKASGDKLKAAVALAPRYGSRASAGAVTASWSVDASRIAGTDAAKRPLLYTPNPLVSGSSVSHWDVSAFRNQLMEPNINADLTTSVVPPQDLTVPLLKDLGW